MKKSLLILTLIILLTLPTFAFNFSTTPRTDTSNTNISTTLLTQLLEDNLVQSLNILEMSRNLEIASTNINGIDVTNIEYVLAMLRLSDDIGKMADRIGEMADRIVLTEVMIDDIVYKLINIGEIIIGNNMKTQANLLKAQENFNNLLIELR